MSFRLQRLSGPSVEAHIPALAQLRMEVFREYPYLYDGSLAYEARYLQTYATAPNSCFVLAFSGEDLVGVSTGVPLLDESPEFQQPFIEAGYQPERLFYFGESVIRRDFRGRGTGAAFFREREEFARSLGGIEHCLFCAVDRPKDHPQRPVGYKPLDSFWRRMGYRRHSHLKTQIAWKQVGEAEATLQTLSAWLKPL